VRNCSLERKTATLFGLLVLDGRLVEVCDRTGSNSLTQFLLVTLRRDWSDYLGAGDLGGVVYLLLWLLLVILLYDGCMQLLVLKTLLVL